MTPPTLSFEIFMEVTVQNSNNFKAISRLLNILMKIIFYKLDLNETLYSKIYGSLPTTSLVEFKISKDTQFGFRTGTQEDLFPGQALTRNSRDVHNKMLC